MDTDYTVNALRHFRRVDRTMFGLLSASLDSAEALNLPQPKAPKLYFQTLASSINSQQISTKAAVSIWSRLVDMLGEPTPGKLLAANNADLANAGLSRQKIRYLRSLADYAAHEPHFWTIHERDNQTVIDELTTVVGIGQWTAEMFLIFALARPDVFSYGDLGLMKSLEQNYDIHYKDVEAARTIIEPLSPHRTAAALALWFHKDNGPVVL